MIAGETTENLLKVMQEFQWPESKPIFYRLYHDDEGQPLFYSMEELPGTYIEVDQQTYITANYAVKVVDGKLVVMESKSKVTKLVPCQEEGICCDPRDICVIVTSNRRNQRWKINTNDQD